MRPAEELINKEEPGWNLVKAWIDSAKNKVEVLASNAVKAKEALYQTQVTTRSPMGAIIYHTGGILVDHGWIRILGSGNTKLSRSLPEWNKGKSFAEYGEVPSFLLIADDVAGGFYLLNGGGLGPDKGKVYYFAPDNLEFEPLDLTYTDFLMFCFNNDLDQFYAGTRWTGWEKDVTKISGDQAYSFHPFLWTKEGEDINKVSKGIVPVEEQYHFNIDMRQQLGLNKSGDTEAEK